MVIKIAGYKVVVEYDGNEHKISGFEISCTGGCSLFDENLVRFSGVAIAKGTNAGKYPIVLTKEQFSYSNGNVIFEVENGELEITKAEIVIKITGNSGSMTYTGEVYDILGYSVYCESYLFDENLMTFTGMAIVEASDVGTHFMGLNVNQFGYDNNNINATFEVEDGKLEIKEES